MKILLVEDSRSIAMVMGARLASFGHEVEFAENGQVAVEKFRESSPDLVLMDIEMPVMDGFQATNKIRSLESTQKWAWTPIMFLTASDSAQNLITAIEAGADDYLVKGLSEEVLHAKMKAMARIATMRHMLAVANSRLELQASRDGLTGLFNRRWMDLNLDTAWNECTRKKQPFALLMLDVDNFKKFNDRYGHQAGDDCLRGVANAVEGVVTKTNAEGLTKSAFAARYGGEEFAVVIPAATRAGYEACANGIIEAVRALGIPHEQNAAWGIVTISIGGRYLDATAATPAEAFREADAALYQAKEGGRNRHQLG